MPADGPAAPVHLQRITNDLRAAKARGTTTAPAPPSVAVEAAVEQAADDEAAD